MDYRIERKGRRQFLAVVRAFPNEVGGDNKSIPNFWTECYERNLIEPMKRLRREGTRDLYGLCYPPENGETHFRYAIGILLDEDTDQTQLDSFLKNGYEILETQPAEYAVFKCFGEDSACLSETWSKFYKEFVPQTGYAQTDDADMEIYPENGESGLFCELWIPVEKMT